MLSILRTVALLGFASTVTAHGYIENIHIAGTDYRGFIPDTDAWSDSAPESIAWATKATDHGFTADYSGPDIICHKQATPGVLSAEVAAGDTVTVQWNQWLPEHDGPVITYLAACNGDCATVDKTQLKFFKVDAHGYEDGVWASDRLMQQGNSWDIIIPADLKPDGYVLRHEIIALHGAFGEAGAQPYPQCINLKVTGGGTATPSGTPGMELYTGAEEGFHFNVWNVKTAYPIPGPALYKGGDTGTKSETETETEDTAESVDSASESTAAAAETNTAAAVSSSETVPTTTETVAAASQTTVTVKVEPTVYLLEFMDYKFDCTMKHEGEL
ncbi:glycosyl hydrolase family 61-domain-containing protein [Aspergillus egyptiacus]|nr:glycosyl hydrolase family 61-domain-containing protein [Aspergillus egyptiacus]